MENQIATTTNEPENHNHYLLSANDLVGHGAQSEKLEKFLGSNDAKMMLGGTTYKYSIWAVRTENGVEIWRTPHDFTGRWANAKKRSWNKQ